MAKEFDIYLKNRLTECDVIVYSLTYRDGLTVMERMILESCLTDYSLLKTASLKNGFKLSSHIDKMIKLCCEQLNEDISIASDAMFHVHYSFYLNDHSVEIDSGQLWITSCITASPEGSAMEIALPPLETTVGTSFGGGASDLEVASFVGDTFKHNFETITPPVVISVEPMDTRKHGWMEAEAPVVVSSDLPNIFYRVHFDSIVTFTTQIETFDVDMVAHGSLGGGSSALVLGSVSADEQMTYCSTLQNDVLLASAVSETLRPCARPETGTLALASEVKLSVKRCRRLDEMDPDTLDCYDGLSLHDVDFILLED